MTKRLLRDSVWIWALACLGAGVVYLQSQGLGVDAHAYWQAWHGPMYGKPAMTRDAYLYSPAFAQVLWPLTLLPWPVFIGAWTAGLSIGLAWLWSPLGWRWAIPLWISGLPEIIAGNVFIPLAIVAAMGLRTPATWLFAALTKIAPCVGPIWFLVRREWRPLGLSLAATICVALASMAIAPQLWLEWGAFLVGHSDQALAPLGAQFMPPLVARVPIAVLLLCWGALTDRRWVIPVAMLLLSPVLWLGSLTLLAAIPRIRRVGCAEVPVPVEVAESSST